MPTEIKVAVIHDWLVKHRGGEKVLDAILELYPSADVFTLFSDPDSFQGRVGKHKITNSWLHRWPGIRKYYRALLPLMPLAAESLDLTGYPLVISTSHCVAKGVLTDPGARHFTFCHTPARYAWDRAPDYIRNPILRALAAPMLSRFREWDVISSQRVEAFSTNSHWVASRVRHYYRREAVVVPPFADLDLYRPIAGEKGDYYLVVSALVPYKKIELAIEACEIIKRKLFVVGTGPEERRLRRRGGAHTTFLGYQSDQSLADLYAGARALLFPGVEDFGIVPIEAMACDTPVIAYGKGGVLDTVVDGKTGLFFREQSVNGMEKAIRAFEALQIPPGACREQALNFSRSRFLESFRRFVDSAVTPIAPLHAISHENTL
ncbi:MAG: glycosyltransferase [Deltaproteobacteria bacterium]|nr:glycosyltransferase [Deltaproteobacteria bacterium]MBI3293672.1 glycosyltransferase [Deltaproteobacteria bacterium]